MSKDRHFLQIDGNRLVNQAGERVILRGVGLGGWMNMENFITGFPANEAAQREALLKVLGPEKYDFFFDRFLDYFFRAEDAQFLQSLGLNLLRLPVNYRHFEDDMRPFEIKEEGFKHLDRVINLCAEYGIYTVLDLHALPGYQNQEWHADNPTHKAFLWQHKHFQDRTVHLWEVFAERYKNNAWVAGYNPINEPSDLEGTMVGPFCRRLYDAIRAIDPDHVIFMDGNLYSRDFTPFGEPWPGVVYTIHHYPAPGHLDGGPYPGETAGRYYDGEAIHTSFVERSEYQRERGMPVWVGEFGPVYTGDAALDAGRDQLLQDQLNAYNEVAASWAIWTYKDIGVQGMVYTPDESPWRSRLKDYLAKKDRLGADRWGGHDVQIRHLVEPLEKALAEEFPGYDPLPFGTKRAVARLVRNILLSEPLLDEFAACFAGLDEAALDELLQSFLFKNCAVREKLCHTLSEAAKPVAERVS